MLIPQAIMLVQMKQSGQQYQFYLYQHKIYRLLL